MPSPSALEQQARKILGELAPGYLSNSNENHAVESVKFANRPRARAASRDRSIEQESMMSEEKSQK